MKNTERTVMGVAIVYDLVAIALVVLFAIIGRTRGLLSMTMFMLKWAVALVLAASLSGSTAEFCYDEFVAPGVEERVEEYVAQEFGVLDTYEKLATTLDAVKTKYNIPDDVSDSESILSVADSIMTEDESPAHSICNTIVRPVILDTLRPICYVVIFVVVLLVCIVAEKILKLVNKIPILGTVNKGLGLIMGLVSGILVLCPLCCLLLGVANLTGNSLPWLNIEVLQNTLLVRSIISVCIFKKI